VANFREEILRQTYPRIANLQEQVQLTYWSEHHLVPQDLLDILPFGRLFSAQRFYYYIDFQLVDLLSAARRCTAYWQLSGAYNLDQSPATQISLFYNETFLWHYFVPSHRPEIVTQIQAGHRIRFLSRFFVSETKVEVEFNEIRLQTNPSGEFTPANLYQIVYSDERILTYHWNNWVWNTNLLTPPTTLIDPSSYFTLPITQPNTQGRDTEYLERFQRILLEPDLLSLDSSYHDSVDSSLPPTLVGTPQSSPPSTPESVYRRAREITFSNDNPDLCFCGIDLCRCDSRHPRTPPTPLGIHLWDPQFLRTGPIEGLHYNQQPGQST